MFSKISFQNKIFIYYSVFIAVILLLLIFLFYSYVSTMLQNTEVKTMEQSVEKISNGLDSMLKEIDTVSTQVLYSKDIQEIMTDALNFQYNGVNFYDNAYGSAKKAKDTLVSINSIKFTARRICIFNDQGSYISVGKAQEDNVPKIKFFSDATWKEDIEKTYDRSTILLPHKDDFISSSNSPLVISFIREILATLTTYEHLGYVEVQQPYAMVENICSTNVNPNSTIILTDEKGNVIYPFNKYTELETTYYNHIKNSSGKMVRRPWDNIEELVYSKQLSYTHWNVMIIQQKQDFMSPVYFLRSVLFAFSFIFMIFTLLIMYFITKSLTAPIREMRKLVKNLSFENLSINLGSQSGNNEVALLNDAFNKTLSKLKESMDQTIQARFGEAHSHLLALQAQMNPHFLYNTLMGISGLAIESGNFKVVAMCSQLSNMLRYVASFNQVDVILKDEILHAENYLKLTKWRLEDVLDYTLDIDQSLYLIKVPKLILQPIVENCFIHGFKNQAPPFKITIKGYVKNNSWVIEITDNGCGFNKVNIDKIFEQIQKYEIDSQTDKIFKHLDIGGMGILNIYMRLRILYGENAIFNITNHPKGGAIISIGGTEY